MSLPIGTMLGPYEIAGALGAGGMGEVYKARDTRLDRPVAVKILPETLAVDPQFRERFDREARAISQLTHPHICTLYDVGEGVGTAFLVMECLEGETLEQRLKKGAMPLGEALTSPDLKGRTFIVAGHTDAKGSDTYNQGLSERRADAVKRFLSEKYGIGTNRLVTVGYGATHLKNRESPLAGENRRVQVVNTSDK